MARPRKCPYSFFVNLLTKLAVPVIAKQFDADELLAHVAQAAARLP